MAARKSPKSKAKRRPRHDGGLYEKQKKTRDPATGKTVSYRYWQASRDVAAENLPPGVERKRITGNGPTPAAAKAKLEANWLAYHNPESKKSGRRRGAPRTTVRELFEQWHRNNVAGAVSDIMAQKYAGYFRLHILPHIGDIYLDQLDDSHLLTLFYETLPKKKKTRKGPDGTQVQAGRLLSTAATRNIYMGLSNCLNYAERKRLVASNPLRAVRAPERKEPNDDIDAASESAKKLLARLVETDDPNYCRWLLQFIGLRRAERLGLSWSSIRGLDTNHPTLTVRQQLARYADGSGWYIKEATKTKKERVIVLHEPFLSALRAHKKSQDKLRKSASWKPKEEFADLVFLQDNGALITLNRDNDEWHETLRKHHLPHWRAHLNRHITATWLAEQDPPVQMGTVFAILGHDSDAVGYYYAKTTEKQQSEPMRRYGQTLAQYTKRTKSRR